MREKEELIQSLYEYLPRLHNGINTNVEYYRTNQSGRADELIIEVIDGLSWTVDAVMLIDRMDNNNINIQELKEVFSEMLLAIENEDRVLIADMLEYEIMPKIEEWFNIVQKYFEVK